MKKRYFNILLILLPLLVSCGQHSGGNHQHVTGQHDVPQIKYAKGFKMARFDDYTRIDIRNPWDTTRTMETYILIDRNKPVPENLPAGNVVKIPVQRVGTCSAIFAGEYKQLQSLDKIVAVGEPEYVYIPEIIKGVADGSIINLGLNTHLNTEKLLAAKTDILVISPFEESMHDQFKKFGVCIVKDASYMEETPLGRTEWIKLEAAFLGKDSLANAIFSGIEKRYLDLCEKVKQTKNRPTVFCEKKFADTWYVAGGKSYMANFLKDAGADYLWKDLPISGSAPYHFEDVYAKAYNADFWLIKYNDTKNFMTMKQLGNEYELYKNFKAYKNGNVFAVNSGIQPYYEKSPLEPDVVLSDMVSIFHPELLPGYKPVYYLKVNP